MKELKNYFSPNALSDFENFSSTGENAFYLMYNGKSSVNEIITRFQTTTDFSSYGLAKSKKDWKRINLDVHQSAISVTNQDEYSAFSLVENNIGSLRYPVIRNFSGDTKFNKFSFTCPKYEELKNIITSCFPIKIVEKSKREKLFYAKERRLKGFIKRTFKNTLGVCKVALTFGRKKFKSSSMEKFNTKLYLSSHDFEQSSHVTQADKITMVFNTVASKISKRSFKKSGLINECVEKEKANFLSELLTTLFVLRANTTGNTTTDKKISDSLTLQIANTVASMKSKYDIKYACKNAVLATKYTLDKMGLTKEDVIEGTQRLGQNLVVDSSMSLEEIMFGKNAVKTQTQSENLVKVTTLPTPVIPEDEFDAENDVENKNEEDVAENIIPTFNPTEEENKRFVANPPIFNSKPITLESAMLYNKIISEKEKQQNLQNQNNLQEETQNQEVKEEVKTKENNKEEQVSKEIVVENAKIQPKTQQKSLTRVSANKYFIKELEKSISSMTNVVNKKLDVSASKAKFKATKRFFDFITEVDSKITYYKNLKFDYKNIEKLEAFENVDKTDNLLTAKDYAFRYTKSLLQQKDKFLDKHFDSEGNLKTKSIQTNKDLFDKFNVLNSQKEGTLQSKIKNSIKKIVSLMNTKINKLEKEAQKLAKTKQKLEKNKQNKATIEVEQEK